MMHTSDPNRSRFAVELDGLAARVHALAGAVCAPEPLDDTSDIAGLLAHTRTRRRFQDIEDHVYELRRLAHSRAGATR